MDIIGYNGIGHPILVPDQPLEPPDCWADKEEEYNDDEEDNS